jgi:glycine/D-amino acid oxidase-like deaminating enzyme
VLAAPAGELSAKRVLVATNGYTDDRIPPAAGGRLLPALSSIMVTRPLSGAELAAQGWTTHDLAYDTRNLLHYFRLLPCGRFLFGGRGGTDASPSALAAIGTRIRGTFETMFPAWAKVETEKRWSGFVCLSFNRIPFAGPLPGLDNAWMAAAYHGSGVAMGSLAGARIAGGMAGRPAKAAVPQIMRTPLRRFPFPTLRRFYLKAAYAAFGWRDEWL